MTTTWYIRRSGASSGPEPFSSEEIRESLAAGVLSAEDSVRSEIAADTDKWIQLGDHDDFFIWCIPARRTKAVTKLAYSGSCLLCFTDLTLLITAWFILTTGSHRLLQLLAMPEAAVFRDSVVTGESPIEDILAVVSSDKVTIAGHDVALDTGSIATALSNTVNAMQSTGRFRLRIRASADVATEAVVRVIDATEISDVPWTAVIIE